MVLCTQFIVPNSSSPPSPSSTPAPSSSEQGLPSFGLLRCERGPIDESSYQTQGHMLAASSSCDTVSKNCGIFWSIFQVSSLTRVTSIKSHIHDVLVMLHNHDVKQSCTTMMWNLSGGSCTVCSPGLGLVGWRGGKRNGKFYLLTSQQDPKCPEVDQF